MAKATPLQQDIQLQELICTGDTARIREYHSTLQTDRPLSRALGYACRYAGPEIVGMLVSGGATFEYNRHSTMRRTNGFAGKSLFDDVFERYYYLLDTPISSEASRNGLFFTDRKFTRVRGDDYDEVVRILIKNNTDVSFDPSTFLFIATLLGEQQACRALAKAGVTECTGRAQLQLADEPMPGRTIQDRLLSDVFERCLSAKAKTSTDDELEEFLRQMEQIVGGPLRLMRAPYSRLSERKLQAIFRHTTLPKHCGKRNLLRDCIDQRMMGLLEWMLDQGWARTWRNYEDLRRYADEKDAPEEMKGMLLARQNASGLRPPKGPSMNPFAASNLRKTWSTRVLEDNTLEITSYKGMEQLEPEIVVVPERIGTRIVTSIEPSAFQIWGTAFGRVWEARQAIREIHFPGTIHEIPDSVLSRHYNLERVVIGEGTTRICCHAFANCDHLTEVVLPSTLTTIEKEAFYSCSALRDVHGGENVSSAGPRAFEQCTEYQKTQGIVTIGNALLDVHVEYMPATYEVAEPSVPRAEELRGKLPLLTYRASEGAAETACSLPEKIESGTDVFFGQFPQTASFALKPLRWTCLAADDAEALLITMDAIAAIYPHKLRQAKGWYRWLHKWLNIDFLDIVFSAEERARIVEGSRDRVFLLNEQELETFAPLGHRARTCELTEYAGLQYTGHWRVDRHEGEPWLLRDEDPQMLRVVASKTGSLFWFDKPSRKKSTEELASMERCVFLRPALRVMQGRV